MKKNLLCISLLIAVLGAAHSQQLVVRNYIEKTQVGPKVGTAIGFKNKYNWEYGGFYQQSSILESLMNDGQKASLPKHYEREFFGAYFASPIFTSQRILFKMHVRTGVSNRENFAITSSILADYTVNKNIHLGIGVGSRAFRPTLQGSVSFLF